MKTLALCVSLVLQLAAARHVFNLKHVTRHSTAEPARRWAIAAVLCSLATTTLQLAPDAVAVQIRTALLHLSVTVQLTPLISILGARRPGVRAWPWFVILPMLLVFQWPSASQVMAESAGTAVVIERPSSLGLMFVVVMGAGNYFGTRFTCAAVLGALGIFTQHFAVSEWAIDLGVSPGNVWLVAAGTTVVCIAVLQTGLGTRTDAPTGLWQELWVDYRDIFGIVWARRVADRVNQFAVRESWNHRLTLDGFVSADAEPSTQTEARNDQVTGREGRVLCWILRRFVDREFLERYLADDLIPPQTGPLDQPPSESA